MPTYHVHYPKGTLDPKQKQEIAKAITETHAEITGAQQFFAQVLFREIQSEDWYLAGNPLDQPHLFIFGYIRSGRSTEVKAELLRRFGAILVQFGGVQIEHAWVYLSDVPASSIFEYGEILPDPENEAAWLANAPEFLRQQLQTPNSK